MVAKGGCCSTAASAVQVGERRGFSRSSREPLLIRETSDRSAGVNDPTLVAKICSHTVPLRSKGDFVRATIRAHDDGEIKSPHRCSIVQVEIGEGGIEVPIHLGGLIQSSRRN